MAAAIWAWRLAEASNKRLKADLNVEKMNSSSWAKAHGKVCNELAELSRKHADTQLFLNGADQQNQQALDHINKLATKNEALENEIEGLNVDKLYLKERLRKFEADAEKRREQKREGMRRFRANKKQQPK